ncbi:T9SS type A sorting domain-containing protein [Spirosoma pollinicola]|uniref:T9SS C-terminal target domain-containing protein n=1 Tax=Spirosoma pollinicola TaxID=2057025 RepID=A0A2K8ZBS5_9BACT|nr:T9SS type A sorting domain-containing protein [Spirosoma pollinicola]AUD07269.1 T9SS C-terminal target domain-containing protein [Spirosoma pollinicola]
MKHISVTLGTAILFLLPILAIAQIQVSFPTSRAVLQRNSANQTTLRITGFYTASVTRVEAHLVARDGQGTTTDWKTIQDNPTGGAFAGDVTGSGGWYNLEVRGMNGDQQVGNTTTVERVGIGEVFIIAGQSNAQGIHQSAPNPLNDRVNCVNYRYPDNGFPNDPPTPAFSLLDNSSGFTIAPRGVGSWCWGQLGDLLVKRLNVPVMFFNAAFTGTSSQNWSDTTPDGGIAYGPGGTYEARQPYINLKIALQFYANTLGVRAILWQQGETDNLLNVPTSQYVAQLQTVIAQSRRDYGRAVSWVVARSSYGDNVGADANIIDGQNQVISSTANVFAGPNTDNIQVPRRRPPLNDAEGFHFDFDGLVEVAGAWNNSLNDSFFQSSTPASPSLPPTILVACASNNSLTFNVNGTYSSVQWESGESGNSITKGAGVYRAKVKDALGNTLFTGQVRVSDAPVAAVVNNGPPSVCIGSSLGLTTNYDNITWFDQKTNTTVATSRTFSTVSAGAYYVRYRDISGCDFTSNVLNVSVNPLPPTPTIANDKPTTFCQGDNTTLRASADNIQYNWSDGQANKVISVGNSGAYFLTVTDQNGCTSAQSNTIAVTANPVPAKPVIATNGPTTFCADRTITLTAPQDVAYQWTSGQTSQSITVGQSGDFAVRTTNQFGCSSVQSDVLTLKVNPLPQTPTVTAGGATTFCDGNTVMLSATSPIGIIWSSGQTDKIITVGSSGNYAVQALDQNGCLSPFSSIVAVKVNSLPATPVILANPSPIICEGDRATLRVDGAYTVFWSTGDSTQRITTGTAGTYSATVRDANGCMSLQAGSVTVALRPLPPPPTINIIGTYTLEAVSSTNGTQFRWRVGSDSLAAQTAIIKASQSGIYTARSSIIYDQTLTCFSVPSAPITFTLDMSMNGLSIYPNPNPDKIITLETQFNLTNAVITIYTLSGQAAFTTAVPSFDERKQLVLTGLPSGYYILRVQSADFDVSKRIIMGL